MKLALLSAAAVAATLLAGAAVAQDSSTSDPNAQSQPSSQPSQSAPSAGQQGSNASANTNVILVTNGPIPDTPENRARYGKPNSAAGRNSKPAGN